MPIKEHAQCWVCQAVADLSRRHIPLQYGSVMYSLCESCQQLEDSEIMLIMESGHLLPDVRKWILSPPFSDDGFVVRRLAE